MKNADQNNFEFGHFLRSENFKENFKITFQRFPIKQRVFSKNEIIYEKFYFSDKIGLNPDEKGKFLPIMYWKS